MPDPVLGPLDVSVSITGDLAPRLDEILGGFRVAAMDDVDAIHVRADERDGRLRLSIDGHLVFTTDDLGALVHQAVWEITQRAVSAPRGGVILHAALVVVGAANVVISGASGCGKSTLTAALVERGARYVTDEATAVDDVGTVRGGLVRPIHLDRRSVDLVGLEAKPRDVVMPGGGRYVLPDDRTAAVDVPAPTVLILLGDHHGPLRVTEPRRSDVVAHLVRERFTGSPTSLTDLAILKELSAGVVLATVRGGTVMDRAYLAETLATQDKVIASA